MRVPPAPLPGFRRTLRALVMAPRTGVCSNPRPGFTTRLYRRGSEALAAAAETYRRAIRADAVTAWFPDYFCNEALDRLRHTPVRLAFYPIGDDLAPDWSALEARVPRGDVAQLLVLVHYFGFRNAQARARQFCDERGLVFVEDAAHLLPVSFAMAGDVVVFSLRKVLAAPCGGVLVLPTVWASELVQPDTPGGLAESLAWLARRTVQDALVRLRISWPDTPAPGAWRPAASRGGIRTGCDPLGLRLLAATIRDIADVAARRRDNYRAILGEVAVLGAVRALHPVLPDDACPYAFPLLVQDDCASLVDRLRAAGVPAGRWPDLPPEVTGPGKVHGTAVGLYRRLVLLPVHQSMTSRQIQFMTAALRSALDPAAMSGR